MQTTFYILYVQKEFVSPGEDDVEEIFYVGRTSVTIERRLIQHLSEARCSKTNNPKNQYILKQLRDGCTIKIRSVSVTTSSNLTEISQIENDLITAYKNYGYQLLNERSGFSGSHTGCNARIDWSEEHLALLGTDYDKNIAQILNCDTTVVTRKRQDLEIPAFKITKWNPEWNSLLGKLSDRQLSKDLKVSRSVIAKKRQSLGIPPLSMELMWSNDYENMLGKMSDREIADLSGTSRNFVKSRRDRLNIPSFKVFPWTKETIELFKHFSDKEIAEIMKCSISTVKRKRKQLT